MRYYLAMAMFNVTDTDTISNILSYTFTYIQQSFA